MASQARVRARFSNLEFLDDRWVKFLSGEGTKQEQVRKERASRMLENRVPKGGKRREPQ